MASPASDARSRSAAPAVLMIGSEALPFSKTGGLADVLGALPQAIARLGWHVTLAVPRYRGTTAGTLVDRTRINVGGHQLDVGFFVAPTSDGARATLIDIPALYDRDSLYATDGIDYPDNARRFGALVRAALEFAVRQGPAPLVVHAHDWQAGLAPVYLRTLFASHPLLGRAASILTIHNLAYQGLFAPDWLPRLDLPWSLLSVEQLEFWGKISFLKGGINAADFITTVSPRYAAEIQTPELGFGFDGILRARKGQLAGVLNGIDTVRWDPSRDSFLPKPFSASDLSGKLAAKEALLSRYGFPGGARTLRRPLIGMIARMVDQKGLDLISALGGDLAALGASFVVLGTGEAKYQDFWRRLAAEHPDRFGVHIGFDEGLAHLIEGGADMFLMPSKFEPCGLNQMYSLRYGTVPIVHRVGGLADTVVDHAPGRVGATGFVFDEYRAETLLATLRRALAVFRQPAEWRALQAAGMAVDHSWDRSAREYVKIYERLLTKGDVDGSRERADLYGR
jgi:starch synthase